MPTQTENASSVQDRGIPPAADPLALFAAWMADAEATEPNDPNAMTVATCTPDGRPSARIVLLKDYDAAGFVFYTNHEGRKGQELYANPHAALLFHWKTQQRQIRIEGPVTTSRARCRTDPPWNSGCVKSTPVTPATPFPGRHTGPGSACSRW